MRTSFDVWRMSQKDIGHETLLVVPSESQFKTRSMHALKICECDIRKKSILAAFRLGRVLATEKPDVVISHSSTDSWLVYFCRVILRYKFKWIRFRHVSAPISGNLLTKFLYQTPDLIVTTSSEISDQVRDVTKVPPDRVHAIPTGVDLAFFDPNSTSQLSHELTQLKRRKTLLMVATLRSWKGHSYVLDALVGLGDWDLWIVGDGPQFDNLQEKVLELGLSDFVRFFGHQTDVRPYFLSCDIFVQPSYANEGVSQSLIQAMAMRIPVVVTDIGGLNEVVKHGINGFLIPPKDVESIISAVKLIGNDVHMRSELTSNARVTIEGRHSSDYATSEFLKCLKYIQH